MQEVQGFFCGSGDVSGPSVLMCSPLVRVRRRDETCPSLSCQLSLSRLDTKRKDIVSQCSCKLDPA